MTPIELSTWVASIWPLPRDDRKSADLVIRRATPLLVSVNRRRVWGAISETELQHAAALGIWRSIQTFNPDHGFFFCHARQRVRSEIGFARSESTIPIVWRGESTHPRHSGLSIPHVAGWRERQSKSDVGSWMHDSFDESASTLGGSIDLTPESALLASEVIEQLDRDLLFVRLDRRSTFRKYCIDGWSEYELADVLGVARSRISQLTTEWREIRAAALDQQLTWLVKRAAAARQRIPSAHLESTEIGNLWQAIADDYHRTALLLNDGKEFEIARPKKKETSKQQAFRARIPEVVNLHRQGLRPSEIAAKLGISRFAVTRAVQSKYAKLA